MKHAWTASAAVAATAVALLVAAAPGEALAQGKGGSCVDKGGKGWGGNKESARFQAWEAVLQATDWGMWAAWMGSGAKIGQAAAGYSVSNVRERCSKDGSQDVCIMRAKLCK